jgi:DNA-binding CsgD family transcriptional regulator
MVDLSRWPDPQVPAAERLTALHPRGAALTLVVGLAGGHLDRATMLARAGAEPEVLGLLEAHGVLRREEPGALSGWEVPAPWWPTALAAAGDEAPALAAAIAWELDRRAAPARLRAQALELAGDPQASAAWRLAADQAGGDADARAEYRLRAWRGSAVDGRGCADALLAVGRTDEALVVLAEALGSTPRREAVARARLLACQHRAMLLAGQHEAAARALAEASAALGQAGGAEAAGSGRAGRSAGPVPPADDPPTALAQAEVATLRAVAEVLVDPVAAAGLAEQACRSAERAEDLAGRAGAVGALALARSLAGEPDLAGFDQALALAEDAGDAALEARIAANRTFALWRSGALAAMEASVASELARLERTGLAAAAGGQLLVARAVALHGLGRWAELGEHLERALAQGARLGAQVELLLRLVAVELVADLGRPEQARMQFEALAGSPAFDDPEIAYERMAVRLRIALLVDDLPRASALALVDEAMALAGALAGDPFAAALVRVGALRLLAGAHGCPGGPVDGLAGVAPAGPGRAEGAGAEGAGAGSAGADGPAELRALLLEEQALRTGQGWAAAIEAWGRLPMPYRQAWARVWAAHAAAAAGRSDEAIALLEAAELTARALAAEPLAAAAQRLARDLGRRAGRTQGQLTARERDVLGEVARGLTNREVARALRMSDRTVAVHLTRIFAKLGAGTRGEAVHLARHAGELPPVAGPSQGGT